jgi:hypothetical protein
MREHITVICRNGVLGIYEAKTLASQDWLDWSSTLNKQDRNEAIMIYHAMYGFVDSVSEGYDTGDNDPQLLELLRNFAKHLNLY